MRYMCPGAESMSEFVGLPVHEYGDCGPDATLMALHAVARSPFPLSPYGLGQIDADEQRLGDAESNGAQNIPHMDAYLAHLGIPHATVGYDTFTLAGLHTALHTSYGPTGCSAVIVETSAAGAGLPDDESGVQYHFFSIVGMDDAARTPDGFIGGYLRVDGDSRTDDQSGGLTAPILTSWQEIANTAPIAYIVLPPTGNTGGTAVWKLDLNAQGQLVGAHDDKGHTVGAGFADLIRRLNLTATDGLMSERYYDAGHSACGLSNDMLLLYDRATDTSVSGAHGGAFAAEMVGLLATAQTAIQQLQAELAAAQKGTPDTALGAAVRAAFVANGFSHS